MAENNSQSGLMPSNDEIKDLLTQMAQYAPMQVPVTIFQLFCAQMMVKEINKWKEKLNHEISELTKKLGQ